MGTYDSDTWLSMEIAHEMGTLRQHMEPALGLLAFQNTCWCADVMCCTCVLVQFATGMHNSVFILCADVCWECVLNLCAGCTLGLCAGTTLHGQIHVQHMR